jgi:hypothetical protein
VRAAAAEVERDKNLLPLRAPLPAYRDRHAAPIPAD